MASMVVSMRFPTGGGKAPGDDTSARTVSMRCIASARQGLPGIPCGRQAVSRERSNAAPKTALRISSLLSSIAAPHVLFYRYQNVPPTLKCTRPPSLPRP